MKRTILMVLCLCGAVCAWCETVNCSAGQLSSLVSDVDATSLTITGTMDARDFKFITDEMDKLTSINLGQVTIAAYQSETALYDGVSNYLAQTIPVTAFFGKKLTSVTLPMQLQAIGMAAFAACPITSITLPAELDSIGAWAFTATKLTTVTIPAMVTYVGDGAFARCENLTTVKVADGSSLTTVGNGAFIDCGKLTSISLGNSLKSLGAMALAGTGMTTIDLTASSSLKEVGNWAFVKNDGTTEVKLPSSVQTMGEGAMLYMNGLTTVTLPASLKRVSNYLLAGNSQVTTLDFVNSSSIDTIGDYAFYNMSGVTSTALPYNVVYIGTKAMAGMTGLTALEAQISPVPALGDSVWAGVDQAAATLKVPTEQVDNYKAAEQWKEFMIEGNALLGDVNLDGVVNVGDISCVIGIITGSEIPGTFGTRDDVNGDGVVNTGDVSTLVGIIAAANAPMLRPEESNTNDIITIDDFGIKEGEVRTIAVNLDNSNNYNALQCDIVLPAGLRIVEGSIRTSERTDHQQVVVSTTDNGARIIMFSPTNTAVRGNEGAILTMNVTASERMTSDAQITVDNVVLSDGDVYYAPATTARVSNTSGIDELSDAADRVWVKGHKIVIKAATEGVAQLVWMNGASQQIPVEAGVNETEDLEPGFYIVVLNGISHKLQVK